MYHGPPPILFFKVGFLFGRWYILQFGLESSDTVPNKQLSTTIHYCIGFSRSEISFHINFVLSTVQLILCASWGFLNYRKICMRLEQPVNYACSSRNVYHTIRYWFVLYGMSTILLILSTSLLLSSLSYLLDGMDKPPPGIPGWIPLQGQIWMNPSSKPYKDKP